METQLQLAFNTDSHGLMASELVEKYATECKNKGYIDEYIGELNVKTIQNRLLELDKGQKLAWWKKHGSFTNFLLQYTGLTRDSLGLNEEPSTFNFNDAPNLPSVNLNVNEYWQIAKPVYDYTLNSANSLNYYNVDIAEINFWITKNERALATGKTQWLCVRDELEYDFLVRRLKANDAFNFVELNNLNEDELKRDDHIEKIFEFTPLAVCILEKIHEFDFLKLLQMRKKQSLFIISKYKSPFLGQLLSSENKNDYNFECSVDCFTWTYVDNWREKFIEWIENRYKSAKKRINFNGLATKN
jgi:hypothetical protein